MFVNLDKPIVHPYNNKRSFFIYYTIKRAMTEPENRKEFRRNKIKNSNKSKTELSDEQRFLKKSKKRLKQQIEDTRSEEVWEDWENQ
jgi:hypothetical protein